MTISINNVIEEFKLVFILIKIINNKIIISEIEIRDELGHKIILC